MTNDLLLLRSIGRLNPGPSRRFLGGLNHVTRATWTEDEQSVERAKNADGVARTRARAKARKTEAWKEASRIERGNLE